MTIAIIIILGLQALLLGGMGAVGLWVQRRQAEFVPPGPLPAGGVSVILPIKGLDPGAAEHYRHWLAQQIDAPYEVIFSLQDPYDPALLVIQSLIAAYPHVTTQVLVNPVRPGLNGKGSNLFHGVTAASHPNLIMADSDIDPPLDVARRMLAPLADSNVGEVACLAVARNATNVWGGTMALALNLTLTAQWAPAIYFGRSDMGASGACFAIRREMLAGLGGVEAFGGYVAEDAEMAQRLIAAGKRVVLGPTVTLHQDGGSLAAVFSLASRGSYLIKHGVSLRYKLFAGFALFAPALLLLLALVAGNPAALDTVVLLYLVRVVVGGLIQVLSGGERPWRFAWTMPLMDAVFMTAFVRAMCTDVFSWRGLRYRVGPGGRITRLPEMGGAQL